jgi:hypothetical protein
MGEISKPKGFYSFFIGIAGFYYMYAIWKALNSSGLSDKYLYITIPLIFGTIIWQSKQVEKIFHRGFKDILFSHDVPKPQKWALIFCISVGVAVFLAIFTAQCIVWSSDQGWLRDNAISLMGKYTGLLLDNDVPSVPWLIIEILVLSIFSTLISASVFLTLFMGTTFTCFSLIIALHKWLNGGGFDIGVFLEALFDFSLSDTLSYIIVIGQFIVSQFLIRTS